MDEKSQAREALKSLAEEVAETVSYLRELGVDGLEGATPKADEPRAARTVEQTKRARPPAVTPALVRNASAERPAPAPPKSLPTPPKPSAAQPRVAGEPPPTLGTTAMPTKPVRTP